MDALVAIPMPPPVMFRALAAALVALAVGGCASPHIAIEQFGEMRAVMRDGHAEPRVRLADVAGSDDVHAVGAISGLHGEVTITDGQVWVARVEGDSWQISGPQPASDDWAALLTVARVPRWSEHPLPAEAGGAQLEAFIERMARENGIDTSKPFAFLIECEQADLDIHIVNGYCPHGVDPQAAGRQPWRWSGRHEGPVRIVGFFAADAAGDLTHHGTSVHAHAILTMDGQLVTGHVDAMRLPAGAVVRLPAAR